MELELLRIAMYHQYNSRRGEVDGEAEEMLFRLEPTFFNCECKCIKGDSDYEMRLRSPKVK